MSIFLRKEKIRPFVYFFIVFCLYTALHNQRSMLNFFVFHISQGWQLFFFNIASSSSFINWYCLMLSLLLIIFSIGLSVTSGEFPSRFLKCSFHFSILSSWLAAFNFDPEVLFLPFLLFIVCYSCLLIFWVSNFIDLALNVFKLFFLVCVN